MLLSALPSHLRIGSGILNAHLVYGLETCNCYHCAQEVYGARIKGGVRCIRFAQQKGSNTILPARVRQKVHIKTLWNP
jgi:hypothetical protein